MFSGELDILEIRLNILDPYVDMFVIGESDMTFSGLPKPLYYAENEERFKKWAGKILYLVIDDYPNDKGLCELADSSDLVPPGMEHYRRSFYQKESLKKALRGLNDDDIVYYGDCDEIWKPKDPGDKVYKLRQKVYAYYLNNRSDEPWRGTLVSKYKNIREGGLNDLRAKTEETMEDGGWHFTSMGGYHAVIKKLESYDHQEVNTPEVKNRLKERMEKGEDFIGRDFKMWLDESEWPEFLKENKQRYVHLTNR